MTTPKEKAKLVAKINLLFTSGEIEQIEEIVRIGWIVFPELEEPIRDNDRIAFAAVSSAMQIGHGMSDRLRKDIPFFVRAFDAYNVFRKIGPISIANPRDLFFLLQFARDCCYYSHLIAEVEVAELFAPLTIKSEHEAALAFKTLIYSIKDWRDINAPSTEARIKYFKSKVPGFAESSYQYAHEWLSRNITNHAVFG